RAPVLDEDVGRGDQVGEHRRALRVLQVEGDRELPPGAIQRADRHVVVVPLVDGDPVTAEVRRVPPGRVARAAGALDLDDPGAEAREEQRGVRPGKGTGDVEDGETVERALPGRIVAHR